MKKNKFIWLFVVGIMIITYGWYYMYTYADEYVLYRLDQNGNIDTTEQYLIAPRYYKIDIQKNDTLVRFYDSNKNLVVSLKYSDLKFYTLKNN